MNTINFPLHLNLAGLCIEVIKDNDRTAVSRHINDYNVYQGKIWYADTDTNGKQLHDDFVEYIFIRAIICTIMDTTHYKSDFVSAQYSLVAKMYHEFLRSATVQDGLIVGFTSFGLPAIVEYDQHDYCINKTIQGECQTRQNRIIVFRHDQDRKTELPKDKVLHIFHHEFTHWMMNWLGMDDFNDDENFVNTFGLLLAQVTPQLINI